MHAIAAARRDHEQRHAQGRTTGRDEDHPFRARPRGPLADALLAAQRSGIHRAGLFIANLLDEPPAAMPVAPMTPPAAGTGRAAAAAHNGPAYWIKVSAQQDGSLTVTNTRNGFSKTYAPRADAGAPAHHSRYRSLGLRWAQLSHRGRRGAQRRHEILLSDPARAEWTHWDAEAEQVHRVSRDILDNAWQAGHRGRRQAERAAAADDRLQRRLGGGQDLARPALLCRRACPASSRSARSR